MASEKRLMDATPDDCINKVKRKTPLAKIIVSGTADRPYYEIMWFDYMDGQFHIGYSSYNLAYVFQWLSECFEIEDAPSVELPATEIICDRFIFDERKGVWMHQIRFKQGDKDWGVSKELPAELVAEAITSAVDAVEVVHGRWNTEKCDHVPWRIKNPEKWVVYKCSVCGYSNGRKHSNYCPNCGAKMDGGNEDAGFN